MADAGRLSGKHALLTGAGGGIGPSAAETYLAGGTKCTIVDLSTTAPDGIVALAWQYPDKAEYIQANVTLSASIERLIEQAMQKCGAIAVLFNDSAVLEIARVLEADEDSYVRVFDVKVKELFFVM